jgi:hypothetical protein
VRALGPSELALRLLPCVAGLAAVAVTFILVRQEAGPAAAWSASALLALSPPFLFHAHEVKHYTLDALFAALLVLLWTRWRTSRTLGHLLAFTAAAVLSFGFSFTGVFVIAVCAGGEAWAERRTPRRLLPFGAALAGLAAVFAVTYLAFPRRHRGHGRPAGPVPRLLSSGAATHFPGWLLRRTRDVLRVLTGNVSGVAAAACVAAGLWIQGRRRGGALAFVLPGLLLLHLAAALAYLYPYGVDRVSLDLAPFACASTAVAFTALRPAAGTPRAGGLVVLPRARRGSVPAGPAGGAPLPDAPAGARSTSALLVETLERRGIRTRRST